jgi:hypothetical protein
MPTLSLVRQQRLVVSCRFLLTKQPLELQFNAYRQKVVDGGIKAQQIGRQKNFAYQKERAAGYGSPFLLVF